MGRREPFLRITEIPRLKKNFRHIRELEKRKDTLFRSVPYALAESVHRSLLSGIPNKGEYKELQGKLKISEVGVGRKGKSGAFAIHIPVKGGSVKKTDASRTVIYIRAKKKQKTRNAAVQLLEDRGPWTMDTLPFWPEKSDAIVVQRKVSVREVAEIAKRQNRVKAKVRRELTKTGRRIPSKSKARVDRKNKALPDLAMLAMDLEFGGQGKPSKPIWRQALKRAKTSVVKSLGRRNSHIRDAWYRPNSKSWKNWPRRKPRIAAGEAIKFKGFQKRLGYS